MDPDRGAKISICGSTGYGQIINNYRASFPHIEQGMSVNATDCKAAAVDNDIAGYNGKIPRHCMNAIAGPLFGNLNDVGLGAAAYFTVAMEPVIVGRIDSLL